MPLIVLISTAIGVVTKAGVSSIANPGMHGFSEILYTFTSMGNNNGSAFAGLNANTLFYNLVGGSGDANVTLLDCYPGHSYCRFVGREKNNTEEFWNTSNAHTSFYYLAY